jgi:hypothetical protein
VLIPLFVSEQIRDLFWLQPVLSLLSGAIDLPFVANHNCCLMEQLESKRRELKAVSAEKRKMDEQERHRKRKAARDSDPSHASPYVRQVCVHLYVLAGYDARVAREYLHNSRQKLGVPEFPLPVLESVIVDWFTVLDGDQLLELQDRSCAKQKRAHAAAVSFFREHELGVWVADHNDTRGLAPRTTTVAEQYDQHGGAVADTHGVGGSVSRKNLAAPKNRMFFSRWRKRVGLRMGKIPASGNMSMEAKRAKV